MIILNKTFIKLETLKVKNLVSEEKYIKSKIKCLKKLKINKYLTLEICIILDDKYFKLNVRLSVLMLKIIAIPLIKCFALVI